MAECRYLIATPDVEAHANAAEKRQPNVTKWKKSQRGLWPVLQLQGSVSDHTVSMGFLIT